MAKSGINIKKIEKADLNFLWGTCKHIKKSTDKIMEEIDENELDD